MTPGCLRAQCGVTHGVRHSARAQRIKHMACERVPFCHCILWLRCRMPPRLTQPTPPPARCSTPPAAPARPGGGWPARWRMSWPCRMQRRPPPWAAGRARQPAAKNREFTGWCACTPCSIHSGVRALQPACERWCGLLLVRRVVIASLMLSFQGGGECVRTCLDAGHAPAAAAGAAARGGAAAEGAVGGAAGGAGG